MKRDFHNNRKGKFIRNDPERIKKNEYRMDPPPETTQTPSNNVIKESELRNKELKQDMDDTQTNKEKTK